MTVKVSRKVFEGIEAVRGSGETNMLDYNTVARLCLGFGYYEASEWMIGHKKEYARLIFEGMEVES